MLKKKKSNGHFQGNSSLFTFHISQKTRSSAQLKKAKSMDSTALRKKNNSSFQPKTDCFRNKKQCKVIITKLKLC